MNQTMPLHSAASQASSPSTFAVRRWIIFILVLLLHLSLLLPLTYLSQRASHPKENTFRVKIGGGGIPGDDFASTQPTISPNTEPNALPNTPSPEVTAPELPPKKAIAPSEPKIDIAQAQQLREKQIAAEAAAKKRAAIEAKKRAEAVAAKKRAQEAAKKRAEAIAAAKKRAVEEAKKRAAEAEKKRAAEAAKKRAAEAERKRLAEAAKKRAEAERQNAIAQAQRKRERENVFNPNRTGPIGSPSKPDNSQIGPGSGSKAGNQTAGGGVSNEIPESYYRNLIRYFDSRWQEPPRSLLGNSDPKVVVELTVSENGRVLASRIISKSGINAMDESVQRMLDNLDLVPRPPARVTFQLELKVK